MTKEHALLQKSDEYIESLDAWSQTRAAIKGKNAVTNIITALPSPLYSDYSSIKHKDSQLAEIYARQQNTNDLRLRAYWARGRYFNATGRTHKSLHGMLWSKPPEVELSNQIQYMEDNANGGNVSLNDVVRDLTNEILSPGREGVLVDMPQPIDGRRPTVEEVENGFQARLVEYKAESIYYWRVDDKTNMLAEVRLLESKQSLCDDGINYETVDYIRRLIITDGVYVNELYNEKCELIESSTPKADGKMLNYIPFQFFGSESNSPKVDNPPLYDLGQMNLGHFVLDCDNRDNLHYHGQGMTNVFTEMDVPDFNRKNPAGLDVGAKGRNMFNQGDKVEILQIAATGAIATEMLRDEQRMVALGAQTVQDINTNVTLGAKELEFGASVSQLKQISFNVSEGITQCLVWSDLFMGGNGEGIEYKLNSDFVTDSLTPEMLNHYFSAVQGGVLPASIYYEAVRSAGVTKLTNEEIEAAAGEDALGMQGESEEVASLRAKLEAVTGESN